MDLTASIKCILESEIPFCFQGFGSRLDGEWIESALVETGTASVRKRKITAQMVVWLVIGMALFRDKSIQEVVEHLGLVLPSSKNKHNATQDRTVVPSAITQSRYRLGYEPIKSIFLSSSKEWANTAAEKNRWRGLSLYGVDGTTFRIPDTIGNREEFGLPGSSRGQSGYPQVRLVALMALRSHLISGVAFGPCVGKKTGECTLAKELWPQVPEQSLTILDRGFIDHACFYLLSHDEDGAVTDRKHWLTRAKTNHSYKTLDVLGDGDELVELTISRAARCKDPSLPESMFVRAIRYQIKGYRPQVLLTSLVDFDRYPAEEIVALYHERWELELGYNEIKTHMLERKEALRSKKPEGIRQEIWGIMLTYNLVRKEMLDVAELMGIPPVQISFRHSLQLIRVFCTVEAWTSAPGNIPKRITAHREMIKSLLILPNRRTDRRYKRHVKIKMSKYKRNPGRPGRNGLK